MACWWFQEETITMFLSKYGFFLVVLCMKETYSQWSDLSIGDSCTLQSTGGQGECKLFNDCATAIQNWRSRRLRPQRCGFYRIDENVCCEKNEITTTTRRPAETSRPGEISRQKCEEYSKYVFMRRQSPMIRDFSIIKNECSHKVVKLIIGGEPANRKEFPHMALIGFEQTPGDVKWMCGGSIISENYILTAGHCLKSQEYGEAKQVRIGVTSLNTRTRYKQDIKVAERIRYPQYKASSYYHDIALIKLERPARFSPYARPACLYLNNEIAAQKAIATGWGKTDYAADEGSNALLKVTLDLFDQEYCNTTFANHIKKILNKGILNDLQVCAGSKTEEKDTCQGDSGGPLQIYHVGDDVKCMYDIVGITSFGKACLGEAGVYTRVSHYIEWIESIVWA